MKIISIVGARPQFIKLAPLSRELRQYHKEIIIHTGQHFDKEMSEAFFSELDIPKPDYNLNINKGLHGEQTGKMLMAIEQTLVKEKPDLIIVFGDTNSTLAGALASAKLQIPSVHVEAGLRSHNRNMPEEINRIVADHTCNFLFAPTKTAFENLEKENLRESSFLTGDIMSDAHYQALQKATNSKILINLSLEPNKYYLLTLHRPYNVDNPEILSNIFTELSQLNNKIVFPVHPRTKSVIEQNNISFPSNFIPIKPMGYLDFIKLQANSLKIITDSGGIQKEAYILKKPCITLRSETEWVETVNAGWNVLINPIKEANYAKTIENFSPPNKYEKIFGEDVARKMTEIITKNV
ncbi:MAG: non-hydrolyzing UDP-N-acetylglucosamine 2-epimerase [bacterium]